MPGSLQVLRQAPPYCCWMGLPSPARHCGQYRVAVVKSQGLAAGGVPRRIAGTTHGYRPAMLIMHSPVISSGVSLVVRANVAAIESSRPDMRCRWDGRIPDSAALDSSD